MQRSECRTPSWLGGYAERRSISMMEHQNAKERLSERIPKFIWGRPSVSSFDDGTSSKMQRRERRVEFTWAMPSDAAFRWWIKMQNCGVLAEHDAFEGDHQQNFLLHPARRMAWKNLRHGVAVFFPSGCRSQTPYRTKARGYKKILQISENNSVFIL